MSHSLRRTAIHYENRFIFKTHQLNYQAAKRWRQLILQQR